MWVHWMWFEIKSILLEWLESTKAIFERNYIHLSEARSNLSDYEVLIYIWKQVDSFEMWEIWLEWSECLVHFREEIYLLEVKNM